MAKLTLSSGGTLLNQYFIDKERLTVGRGSECDITIDDPMVSRVHAGIITVGNDQIVEDLQSVNGTVVNGVKVSRQILKHGDVIEFGAFSLRYLNPKAAADTHLEQTMLIATLPEPLRELRGNSAPSEEPGARLAHAVRIRLPQGKVRIIAGPRAGSVVRLDRVVATFGKAGEQVAVITRRPHGYFITHVEGSRCARVNNQPIGNEPRVLHNHDVIDVGGDRLEFLPD